jgi:DNA-binding helix-hairpin-helix protein with protein kinase domain
MTTRLETGEPTALGRVLAKAGEGTIHEVVGHPGLVAKVFHPTLNDLPNKLDKVAAMTQASPQGAIQTDGFVVLTWPLHVLTGDGGPIGYVMPRIDTATSVEIHAVSNPSNRREPQPNTPSWIQRVTWGHLVNVAANLCLAVDVVHRVGAVIGDFQERNILVSDTTEVSLVDCDSMQFTDLGGREFLCRVGRPEYTAPELAGIDLGAVARSQSSDLFALAVHIHQLLMAGNHPFMRGTWTGDGEQPDAPTLAQTGHWAGGPASLLRTHPLAPPVSFLPGDIQQLFSRAFTSGVHDPGQRPTAGEWRSALLGIDVQTCPRGEHQIPVSCFQCPWCAIDDERAARRRAVGWNTGTGAQKVSPRNTAPLSHGGGSAPMPVADAGRRSWLTTKVLVAFLITALVIVIGLSAFIIWAVLSGASTFGAMPAPMLTFWGQRG